MHIKIDIKIFLFLLIFIITRKIQIYSILMIFSLIHEIGHLICGIFLGLKPYKITILPYGLKINFKVTSNNYNKNIGIKKIILALAGPITNLICISMAYIITKYININVSYEIYQNIIYANLLIALFNMLPIYPLDGGRIVKEIIHIKSGIKKSYNITEIISEITLYILTIITSILILYYKNISMIIVIIYLWIMVYKAKKEAKIEQKIYEKIEKYKNYRITSTNFN